MPVTVTCSRCGQTREGFEAAPIGVAGESAQRLVAEICQNCWQDWLRQQTMLINHYGLNLMDAQARKFLTQNRNAFLFGTGQGSDIDTSQQGKISY
jgi:Fe-S cluster biosynthesis and repair protein YggX